MPSPVTSEDFTLNDFSGDVCERIRKLLEINDTVKEWFAWAFNSDGTATAAFKLEFADFAVAIGTVLFNPIDTAPAGYLICNGQAVSRTTYANLFAVYGTTFGSGDGSTTFNVPNLSARFLMGSGPGGSNAVGSTGGAATVTLTEATMPAHTHGPGTAASNPTGFLEKSSVSGKPFDVLGSGSWFTSPTTESTGGGQAHDNLPPYYAGHWMVKY